MERFSLKAFICIYEDISCWNSFARLLSYYFSFLEYLQVLVIKDANILHVY